MLYLLLINVLFCFSLFGKGYEPAISKIPKRIWQTYLTKDLPKQAREAQSSWLTQNPEYDYELWDDEDLEKYILSVWDADTYAFFKDLPLGVMKADLWRYLIITTEGGIYSDIDSLCCSPIREWAPEILTKNQDVLLLGFERNQNFCQWTIAATPHHPAMKYVCNYLVKKWKEQGIDTKNQSFVLKTTGPYIWTDALLEYIGEQKMVSRSGSHNGLSGNRSDIYNKYLTDNKYREKINQLGVFLLPADFYNGVASKNLYGSRSFGDGYVSWTDQARKFKNNNKQQPAK